MSSKVVEAKGGIHTLAMSIAVGVHMLCHSATLSE